MLIVENPTERTLEGSLVMKSVTTEADADRLDRFNAMIHGDVIRQMTNCLINHFPLTTGDTFLYVEDTATGEIVSSLCLIPWRWRYGEVELKAGEMGIVGTHEDYRRRGSKFGFAWH